jgi:hypothetical protein
MATPERMDAFVAQELAQWAPLLEQRMKEQVSRRRIVASGDLLRSLAAKAMGTKEVQLAFAKHGRFHDMGAQGGWRKGVYMGQSRTDTPKKPKPSKFYSRTKMGLYGQLVSNLANKYVDTLATQAANQLPDGR